MEAVLGLLEDGSGMALEDLCCDLLATIGGQAMKDMGTRSCCCNHAVIDLVGTELGGAIFGLLFLTHADPNIGVEDVSAACSLLGTLGNGHQASSGLGPRDQIGWRTVKLGAGQP